MFATVTAAIMMCTGIAGCGMDPHARRTIDPGADIDELKSRGGVMFEIGSEIVGPINWDDEDPLTGVSFSINWNGTINRTSYYLNSGAVENGSAVMSDVEYLEVYNLAEDAYANNTYADYSEDDVMDGEMYSFVYYPVDREEGVHIYFGYCYSDEGLSNVVRIARSYFNNAAVPDIAQLRSRSGEMLTVYDEQNSTNYMLRWNGELCKSCDGNREYVSLSDDDYMTVYTFAQSAYDHDTFVLYSEDGDDDCRWRFEYYPSNDDVYEIYYGAIRQNRELTEITAILGSYFE